MNATEPHEFVGRLDRWCEVCNRPDRDPIHTAFRTLVAPADPLPPKVRLHLLVVPEQPKWNVPEQRVLCCRSCGQHFIDAAPGANAVLHPHTPWHGDCGLRYEGCEQQESAS